MFRNVGGGSRCWRGCSVNVKNEEERTDAGKASHTPLSNPGDHRRAICLDQCSMHSYVILWKDACYLWLCSTLMRSPHGSAINICSISILK